MNTAKPVRPVLSSSSTPAMVPKSRDSTASGKQISKKTGVVPSRKEKKFDRGPQIEKASTYKNLDKNLCDDFSRSVSSAVQLAKIKNPKPSLRPPDRPKENQNIDLSHKDIEFIKMYNEAI